MAIEWRDTTPADLGRAIVRYGVGLKAGAFLIAQIYSQRGQEVMRVGARWIDRTGNARGGLVGVAQVEGDNVVIYFIHSVEYGVFLELARAGRLAIVWPTTLQISGQVGAALRRMVS